MWCCIFLYAPKRNDAATCLPSFVFASANFAVVIRFTEVEKIRKGMQTETATSAWGYVLLRCSETTRQLVAVVRICVSKFCRSSPFYESQENPKRHANGNGNFRMGLHTSSVRETTRQLVAVVRQFAQANSCRGTPFYESQKFLKEHANGNGNFRMGLYYFVARNDAATCLPSFVNLRKQILAVGSHRPHLYFPIGYIWETATSAWGYILLRCAERRGNFIFI